jgi:hypothetical protein
MVCDASAAGLIGTVCYLSCLHISIQYLRPKIINLVLLILKGEAEAVKNASTPSSHRPHLPEHFETDENSTREIITTSLCSIVPFFVTETSSQNDRQC